MSGITILASLTLTFLLIALVPTLGFLLYATVRYCPVIERIFGERPMFLPLRVDPRSDGESVSFRTADGLLLGGDYFRARTAERVGVLVFCHEYLSDRWSYLPYLDGLRDRGFDVFSFDFRNHGASESDPSYAPLQWVTDHEAADLRGALEYLRSREDRDPAGFGLFGISRGGSTALVVAAGEADVWGVITDGAFPTSGTMTAYILRWAEIYVRSPLVLRCVPDWVFATLGWIGRRRFERKRGCRFPSVERAVAALAPRPWLMIHGQRDAYIGPEIARKLFEIANEPKECWLVAGAKHNRCREMEPETYAGTVASFLDRYAPRRPLDGLDRSPEAGDGEAVERVPYDEVGPRPRRSAGLVADVGASVPG